MKGIMKSYENKQPLINKKDNLLFNKRKMGWLKGLEPSTTGITIPL